MTIEYTPVGIACNLSCSYCYQDSMRDAGNISSPRNWPRVKQLLEKMNYEFTVFGGEPLLAPIEHLEEVWKFGFERFGRNSVQTNGSLITEDHIDLFVRYNVGVGISIDGSGDLNSPRVCNNKDTLLATNNTLNAIKRLCARNHVPSLIVTIHKANASLERIPKLIEWLKELEALGIRYVNFHNLELERGQEEDALNEEDTICAFCALYEWSKGSQIKAEPFTDIYKLLTEENPKVSCVWNHCDPATTEAVHGIEPDGTLVNCGRTNKDGVNWIKANEAGFERYLLLRQTPQSCGGCKDCRFFLFCKGQCPGTAIDGDWRNRTRDCRLWYTLFDIIEQDILKYGGIPITHRPESFKAMEDRHLAVWTGHVDVAHGDSPHGDAHGDSPHGDSGVIENAIAGIEIDEPPEFLSS